MSKALINSLSMRNSFSSNNTSYSRSYQCKNSRIDFEGSVYQISIMDGESFERAVVQALANIIEGKGLRHDPTAKSAWPYKKAAGRTWQAIRSEETGQKLTMRDAYQLARFLGINLSQVCAIVEAMEFQSPVKIGVESKEGISPALPPKTQTGKTLAVKQAVAEITSENT